MSASIFGCSFNVFSKDNFVIGDSTVLLKHNNTFYINSLLPKSDIEHVSAIKGVLQIDFDKVNVSCGGSIDDGSIDLTVSGGTAPYSFAWSNASTFEDISNLAPGVYIVTITDSSFPVIIETDSIEVFLDVMPVLFLGNDTILCDGNDLLLDAANPSCDYLWSNTTTNQTLLVNTSNIFSVTVTNSCGSVNDNIVVNFVLPLIPPFIGNDTAICSDNAIIIDAGSQVAEYLWSTTETTQTISVNTTGEYFVDMLNACGTVSDTINIVADNHLVPFYLGDDTTICVRVPILLDAGNPGANYLWSTGDITQTIFVEVEGTFSVIVTNLCDTLTDTINIFVDHYMLGVYFPSDTIKICSGSDIILNAGNPGANYLWSTGDVVQSISVDAEGTYYYTVSNVCNWYSDTLELVVEFPLTPINLGNDTSICSLQPLILDAGYLEDFLWSTDETTQTITVDTAGIYTVRAINSCGSVQDTIEVFIDYPLDVVNFGSDTSFCGYSPYILDAGNPGAIYNWENGETTQLFSTDTSGVFSVTVSNACGSVADTIELLIDPILVPINLGNDTIICDQSTHILDAGYQIADYLWSTGDITQTISVTETGVYSVTLTNLCGIMLDTISLIFSDSIPELDLGEDLDFCLGDSAVLNPGSYPGLYSWSNSETSQSIAVYSSDTYTLTITNACGSFIDDIIITVLDTVNPVVITSNAIMCVGDNLLLECNTADLGEYLWLGPNGDIPSVQFPIIENVTEADAGVYTFLSSDTSRCFEIPTCTVVVKTPPEIEVFYSHETCLSASDGIVEFVFPDNNSEVDSILFNYIQYGTFSDTITFDSLPPRMYNYIFTVDNVCFIIDSVNIEPANDNCPQHSLYIPDAFTPNGDGKNDILFIYGTNIFYINMAIYNRWSEKIFEFTEITSGWDGTYGGKPCPTGMYVYVLQVFYMDGSQELRKGQIYLLP